MPFYHTIAKHRACEIIWNIYQNRWNYVRKHNWERAEELKSQLYCYHNGEKNEINNAMIAINPLKLRNWTCDSKQFIICEVNIDKLDLNRIKSICGIQDTA